MRSLAVVTGASRPGRAPERTPGRVAGFLTRLAALGPVDLVVVHDDVATVAATRAWWAATVDDGDDGAAAARVARSIEVAAPAVRPPGVLRELHLHRSDAVERAARATVWFRLVDSFVASAPAGHDLVWCADLAALTRAGWVRRALPAVVDVDRFEDLGSTRSRRAARRTACAAHLVTVAGRDRRDLLGLPGSLVASPDQDELSSRLLSLVDETAGYRPARTP